MVNQCLCCVRNIQWGGQDREQPRICEGRQEEIRKMLRGNLQKVKQQAGVNSISPQIKTRQRVRHYPGPHSISPQIKRSQAQIFG